MDQSDKTTTGRSRTRWLRIAVLVGVTAAAGLMVWSVGHPSRRPKVPVDLAGAKSLVGERKQRPPQPEHTFDLDGMEGDGARASAYARLELPSDTGGLLRLVTDRSGRVEMRCAAADRLRQLRAKESAKALQEIFQDGSEPLSLRYKAARALGFVGDQETSAALALLVTDEKADRHLRVVSTLALGTLGGTDAAKALGRAAGDPDRLIRFKAVQALEGSQVAGGREIAQRALNDSDVYVRARALRTLGMAGDEASVATIAGVLERADSDFIRIACLTALGENGRPEAVAILRQYETNGNDLVSLNARSALQQANRKEGR